MDTYHLYDINKAYEDFIDRFGIEPNGVLMNSGTKNFMRNMLNYSNSISIDTTKLTFNGKPIYISEDIGANKIRFVI